MATLTAVARAARKAALAFQARDEAIRAAHSEGATLSAIAAAAGMSKQRAHQIVHAPPTELRHASTARDAP
jgi:hypothetical protein